MSIYPKIPDGYYDKDGLWHRTKFCFVYCGKEKCTCQPPNGIYKINKKETLENDTKM